MKRSSTGSRDVRLSLAGMTRRRVLGVGVIALLLLSGFLAWYQFQSHRQSSVERLGATAALHAFEVNELLLTRLAAVSTIARLVPDESNWGFVLEQVRLNFPGFVTLLRTDANGLILAGSTSADDPATINLRNVDVSDRHYFREPMRTGEPFISPVFRGRGFGDDAIIAVSAPVLDRSGNRAGVVEGSILASDLAGDFEASLAHQRLALLVLDPNGTVAYASPSLPYSTLQTLQAGTDIESFRRVAEGPWYRALSPPISGGRVFASTSATGTGWRVMVMQPVSVVVGGIAFDMARLLAVAMIVLVIIHLAASRIGQQLARPVREIAREMREFALSDRSIGRQLGPESPIRELSEFQHAFTVMIDRLEVAREEIREAAKLRSELHEESRTDALTGALNYRCFKEVFATTFDSARENGVTLTVLSCDIDHFKAFNDRYGHPAGDACLARVTHAIRSALLSSDDRIFRVGGEEFTILVHGLAADDAAAVANRILHSVREAAIPHASSPRGHVTVSLGVATAQRSWMGGSDELLRAADAALYRAKRAGRDCAVIHSPESGTPAVAPD